MFQSATIRLTMIYVAVLGLVCIFFSYNWYNVATRELDRGIAQTEDLLERQPLRIGGPAITQLLRAREAQLQESKREILVRIIAADALIVIAGVVGSYLLARRTLEPIEKAHAAQSRFTADASHELRTPLTAIRSQAEVALMEPRINKSSKAVLTSIIEEVESMTSLTNDLLLLARGQHAVDIRQTDIAPVIKKSVALKKAAAHNKNITLAVSGRSHHAFINAELLQQILVILLDNAIKYSPRDTEVVIKTRKSNQAIQIDVTDKGPGIKPHDQELIFERFYRVDSSREQTQGHGLGLAIARELAQSMRCSIDVKSQPGSGSTFRVLCPLRSVA